MRDAAAEERTALLGQLWGLAIAAIVRPPEAHRLDHPGERLALHVALLLDHFPNALEAAEEAGALACQIFVMHAPSPTACDLARAHFASLFRFDPSRLDAWRLALPRIIAPSSSSKRTG